VNEPRHAYDAGKFEFVLIVASNVYTRVVSMYVCVYVPINDGVCH